MPRPRRIRIAWLLSMAILLIGLGFLAYPIVTEMMVASQASQAISEIEAVYDSMTDEARLENIEQAHAFNNRLLGISDDGDIWDYDMQLTYHEEPSTMMAWIEIPKIGTKLPVYHHATDAVLMAGVGHVDTTCLPVGGKGTLCALSGHSGMQNARMFDDIRALEAGDEFIIWTLGDPYAYRVCDVKTVLPSETGILAPQPGRDLCVLVTCTPLNLNTHRLVVTAERCEYEADSTPLRRGREAVVNRRTTPLLVAVSATLLVASVLAVIGAVTASKRGNGRRRHGE